MPYRFRDAGPADGGKAGTAMYHFFVEPGQIQEDLVTIVGGDVNHIRNVLRMKPGEEIAVSDGGQQYVCRLSELGADAVRARVVARRELAGELPVRISLFQGLPKSDKMEWIIQKCVELGVYEVIPVAMKRCVARLEPKKEEAKRGRWQSIAQSAAKQAGRGIVPQVRGAMRFEEAVGMAAGMQHILVPYEKAVDMDTTRRVLAQICPGEQVAVFIGPEGGFEDAEIRMALDAGASAITLGGRILRTETAGMALLAMAAYALER